MGAAGAGKTTLGSTLAAATGMRFVEGDDLHSPANKAKMARGEALNDADRAPWLVLIAQELARAKEQGAPVVVACSALKHAYRDVLRGGDANLLLVFIEGSRETLTGHLRERTGHFVDERLLESQLTTLEPPSPDEGAVVVSAKADHGAIIAGLPL
ncbi:MAG: gluconokinase [Myxococcota bacterium]